MCSDTFGNLQGFGNDSAGVPLNFHLYFALSIHLNILNLNEAYLKSDMMLSLRELRLLNLFKTWVFGLTRRLY